MISSKRSKNSKHAYCTAQSPEGENSKLTGNRRNSQVFLGASLPGFQQYQARETE